jgi:hypothetical protein
VDGDVDFMTICERMRCAGKPARFLLYRFCFPSKAARVWEHLAIRELTSASAGRRKVGREESRVTHQRPREGVGQ